MPGHFITFRFPEFMWQNMYNTNTFCVIAFFFVCSSTENTKVFSWKMVLEYKIKFCCCISNLQGCKIFAFIFGSLHFILYSFFGYILVKYGLIGLIGMIIITLFLIVDILLYFGSVKYKKWMLVIWLIFSTIRTLVFVFMIQLHVLFSVFVGISIWSWLTVYGGIKEIPLNKIHDKYKPEVKVIQNEYLSMCHHQDSRQIQPSNSITPDQNGDWT